MPIFEYECQDCGTRFEKFVISRGAEVLCTNCQSKKVVQQLSVFAVAGSSRSAVSTEPGPCPCGAPRRGMCGET